MHLNLLGDDLAWALHGRELLFMRKKRSRVEPEVSGYAGLACDSESQGS